MGIINSIIGIVSDQSPMAPVPIVERLRAQCAEQDAKLPALQAAVDEANYQDAVLQSPDTASALSLAQTARDQATKRRDALTSALSTASQKAADAHADEVKRAHEAKLRKLEAFTVTLRRKIKAHAVELERVVRSHAEMLAAVEQVQLAYPGRLPQGHGLTHAELSHWTRQELCRVTCLRDPAGWAKVGNRNFFLGVNPTMAGAFHKAGSANLMTMEQHGTQAMGSLMRLARGLPVQPLPVVQPVPPTNRLPSVVFEPPDTTRTAAEQVWDNVTGATAPEPWDTSLAGQVAEYNRIRTPLSRVDVDAYDSETPELVSAADWAAPELRTIAEIQEDPTDAN
jgi:hypothetical protein